MGLKTPALVQQFWGTLKIFFGIFLAFGGIVGLYKPIMDQDLKKTARIEGMSRQDEHPNREAALRANLLKRKQQIKNRERNLNKTNDDERTKD